MPMKKRKLALIHTSPAAIAPLMRFYTEAAPELEITNQLDDGLLRLLAAGEHATVEERLSEMLKVAVRTYGAELGMVTCSSVTKEMVERLAPLFDLPVLKIDYPMAREAVGAGRRRRIGVAATFAPTIVPHLSTHLRSGRGSGRDGRNYSGSRARRIRRSPVG